MTTPSLFPLLTAVRDVAGAVPGVKTARVGIEANLHPDDYPIVRVVPGRAMFGRVTGSRSAEVLLYFGEPIHEFTAGLEGLIEQHLQREAELLDALLTQDQVRVIYRETVLDEDRVEGYKLFALRLEVDG